MPLRAGLRDAGRAVIRPVIREFAVGERAAHTGGEGHAGEGVGVGEADFGGVDGHGGNLLISDVYSITRNSHKVNSFQMLNHGKILSTCQIVSEFSFDSHPAFCYTIIRPRKGGENHGKDYGD